MVTRSLYNFVALIFLTGLAVAGCETTDTNVTATTQPMPPSTQRAPATEHVPMAAATPAPPDAPSGLIDTAPTNSKSRLEPAAGAADDTLQACMARIPQGATPSQRMLAERTCQRDEETRRPIAGIPGR